MEITTEKKFNPLIVHLETKEVGLNTPKLKTVDNYLTQIKNNYYMSVKAHYLIARDLFDAKVNLLAPDYTRLVEELKFTGATQSKYLAIGRDPRLMKLFISGKLPMKWTTQYLLTQLTNEQFKKVAKKIDAETPAKDICKIADITPDKKTQIANDLLSFLQLQVDKTKVDVSTYEKLVDKVKSALSKIPEISIIDDKVDTVKEKIKSSFEKLAKQAEKLEMAKAIISDSGGTIEKAQSVGA